MKPRWPIGAGLLLSTALALALLWTPDRDPAWLAERHLRSPADLVEVDGVRLHVRVDGPADAPAVLFLHGFGASLHTWEPWAQALSADFRVVRLDLPGSGLSPPDPARDYTDARSQALIEALLDRLGIASTHVVGHSMGGRLAWQLAAAQPARVKRLVLLAPDGFASPGFEYDRAPEVPASLQLMRFALPRWVLKMGLEPAYADASVMTGPLLDRYHDLLLAPGARQAMLDRMAQAVLTDPVPRLRRIAAPTLLLWGEQDAMIPVANAADYLQAIGGSRLVTLPGVGHIPQEESPAAALGPVRDFLTR